MRTIVLTGATSGIGMAAARLLAAEGATLIVQGPQSADAAQPAVREIQRAARNEGAVHYVSADFGAADAIPALADQVQELTGTVDVLVNNAGIPGPDRRTIGPWHVERTFGINYLAGVLLAELLLPLIPDAGRIVNVASATHESATLDLDDLTFERRGYSAVAAYAQSKLAVVTHSVRLASRIPQTVLSLHPGVISSGLLHAMFGVGGDTPDRGGANLANATSAVVPSGSYLDEQRVGRPNPIALEPEVQQELHRVTEGLLGRSIH